MNLFYSPSLEGDDITLDQGESHHVLRVLRKNTGDIIHVSDGLGNLAECEIVGTGKSCQLKVLKKQSSQAPSPFLHIAIAPAKQSERMEWFLEKATEAGLNKVSMIRCARSERKSIRKEKMVRTMIAAMKQSLQCWLPGYEDEISFEELMGSPYPGMKFIAISSAKALFRDACRPGHDALVLIGPEGDFTDAEVKMAIECGFQPVNLSPNRLRTETAGLAAVMGFRMLNGACPGPDEGG